MPGLFHKEFPGLVDLEERLKPGENQDQWEKVEKEREDLVDLLLDGIQYYQRYQADVLTWLIQVMNTKIKLVKLILFSGDLCSLHLSEHGQNMERSWPAHPGQASLGQPGPPLSSHPGGNAPGCLLLCLPDPPTLPLHLLLPCTSVCLAPSSQGTFLDEGQERTRSLLPR